MNCYRSAQGVVGGDGNEYVDWDAVAAIAKATTPAGDLELSEAEHAGYRADVRAARDRLRSVGEIDFDLPGTIEIQHRHHWIDANVETFGRVVEPLETAPPLLPGLSRALNTATMAAVVGFLARNVLGQYDPLLLAESDAHALYFVRPNIQSVAADLDVDYPRFRRWIAFHEVAHAAEFGAAPWLPGYLEDCVESSVSAISAGGFDRDALADLNTAMTAVEGYAELLMDRAFDEEYADLRAKLDAKRQGGGPLVRFMRRLLGLGIKRQQYERGARFFEEIAERRGLAAASVVWEDSEFLPTEAELDAPETWLRRVDP